MGELRYKDLGAFFPMYREDNVRSDLANWKKFTAVACVNDGGGAGTADEIGILVAPHRMMLTAAYVVAVDNAVAAAAASVGWTINVRTAGGAARIAATRNTTVDSMVQYVPFVLVVSATVTDTIIERGDLVYLSMTKAAGRVVVNEAQVSLSLKAVL